MRAGELQAFRRGELVASVHSDGQGRVGLKAGGDGQQFGNRVAAMAHVYDKGAPGLGNLAQFAYAFFARHAGGGTQQDGEAGAKQGLFHAGSFQMGEVPSW